MRIVFVGVVSIARHCLKVLLEREANVVGIFTADTKTMVDLSGMHPEYFSDLADLGAAHRIAVHTAPDVGVPLDGQTLKQLQPDVAFIIGWPQLVRRDILVIPRNGCVGIHPTLLPERRGGAPLNWTLIDGLTESGVTLLYLDEGLDSGDIVGQQRFGIAAEDTAGTLLAKVTQIAGQLVAEYYESLSVGRPSRVPQDHSRATYTRRRRPADGVIDWNRTSLAIYNWTRALTRPFPGAFTWWQGQRLIVWEVEMMKGYKPRASAQPGEVIDVLDGSGIVVATGDSCVLVRTVTAGHDRPLRADGFAVKHAVNRGSLLGEAR